MKKLQKLMSIVLVILLTFPLFSNITQAKEFDSRDNIPLDKEWEIKFNQDVDQSPNILENIIIVNKDTGAQEPIWISTKGNIASVTPYDTFQGNTNYMLEVKNGILSNQGEVLKEEATIHFTTTEGQTIEPPTEPGEGDNGNEYEEERLPEGTPQYSYLNEYGFNWNIYNLDYNNFEMHGEYNGELVGMYSTTEGYEKFGVSVGQYREDVRAELGEPLQFIKTPHRYDFVGKLDQRDMYLIDGVYIQIFYDNHNNGIARSILWITQEMEDAKLTEYGQYTEQIIADQEELMDHLVRQERTKSGVRNVVNLPLLRQIAREHSQDMIDRNFFSHENPDGLKVAERAQAVGLTRYGVNENIIMKHESTIHSHESFFNSLGHRNNMLDWEASQIGSGLAVNDNQEPYWSISLRTQY